MFCPQPRSISRHKKVASITCAFSMWYSKAEVEEKPNGAEKKKRHEVHPKTRLEEWIHGNSIDEKYTFCSMIANWS